MGSSQRVERNPLRRGKGMAGRQWWWCLPLHRGWTPSIASSCTCGGAPWPRCPRVFYIWCVCPPSQPWKPTVRDGAEASKSCAPWTGLCHGWAGRDEVHNLKVQPAVSGSCIVPKVKCLPQSGACGAPRGHCYHQAPSVRWFVSLPRDWETWASFLRQSL